MITPRATEGLDAHRSAAAAFETAVSQIPAEVWAQPAAPGKWSPAEITEHLARSYESHLTELRGGPGIRVRVKGLKLFILRWTVMPKLLRTGRFPEGVRAPSEVAPVTPAGTREAGVARFRELAATFEGEMAGRLEVGKGRITHPFFGKLTLDQALRFVELHVRHHGRQLPGASRMT